MGLVCWYTSTLFWTRESQALFAAHLVQEPAFIDLLKKRAVRACEPLSQ
jgi:hypothetical protein